MTRRLAVRDAPDHEERVYGARRGVIHARSEERDVLLRRQKVLADFGDFALQSGDLGEVLTEACLLVADAMGLKRAKVAISRRTREALAAAKARGVRLGNPNGAAALRRAGKGGAQLKRVIAVNADRHAEDLRAVVEDVR